MKKISLFLCAAAAVLGFSGCASAKIEKESISPLAIITVTGNSSLPWYVLTKDGEEPSANKGLLQNAINSKFYDDDPEFTSSYNRLDYAEDAVRRIFGEIADIDFIDRETVLASKKYKSMNSGILSAFNTTITATDYKDLRTPDRYEVKKLCEDVGAKGCLVLDFEFFKKTTKGNSISGDVVPYVKMRIKMYDSNGKEIKYKNYKLEGSQVLKIKGRNYDTEEFIAMYPEVIDQLLTQVAMEFID